MNIKLGRTVLAGIAATAVMSMVILAAPFMGLPKMSPPEMLAGMLDVSIVIGWMMHFIIGIIFAISYGWFFIGWVQKIDNYPLKGIIFGVAVFIFAQVMMAIMNAMMPMTPIEGNKMLMMSGSLIGHIVYGVVVVLIAREPKTSPSFA